MRGKPQQNKQGYKFFLFAQGDFFLYLLPQKEFPFSSVG